MAKVRARMGILGIIAVNGPDIRKAEAEAVRHKLILPAI